MQAARAHETLLLKVTLVLSLFILLVTITNPVSRLHYSNFHEILSLLMDRNYVFILCNGILIVIAKSSGKVFVDDQDDDMRSSSSSSQFTQLVEITNLSSDDDDDHYHAFDNFLNNKAQLMPSQGDQELINKMEWNEQVFIKIEEEEEKEIELVEYESSFEEDHYENLEEDDNDDEEEEEKEEDDDDDEELSIARMSIEELNRKFEDFIRRMKEEIRIEAQSQLGMV